MVFKKICMHTEAALFVCFFLRYFYLFIYNRNHCKCITIHICNNYIQLTVQSDSRELIRKTH